MSLSSGHGISSGDLNTGDNLSESSFLEALFGLEFSHADFADFLPFYPFKFPHGSHKSHGFFTFLPFTFKSPFYL